MKALRSTFGLLIAVSAISLLAPTGCPGPTPPADGDGDGTATETVSFSGQIQPIFDDNCTVCHAVGGIAEFTGQLLVAEESFDSIVNQPSIQSDFILVVPGDSSASLLFLKVRSDSPPVGSRMPRGGGPLSDDEIALIRDWIDQGAENN